MELQVNGKNTQIDDGLNVAALLEHLGVDGSGGVAVAVNHSVVPRERWPEVTLTDGDRVEVIHAVQGG